MDRKSPEEPTDEGQRGGNGMTEQELWQFWEGRSVQMMFRN